MQTSVERQPKIFLLEYQILVKIYGILYHSQAIYRKWKIFSMQALTLNFNLMHYALKCIARRLRKQFRTSVCLSGDWNIQSTAKTVRDRPIVTMGSL